jgi:hypothetical protein
MTLNHSNSFSSKSLANCICILKNAKGDHAWLNSGWNKRTLFILDFIYKYISNYGIIVLLSLEVRYKGHLLLEQYFSRIKETSFEVLSHETVVKYAHPERTNPWFFVIEKHLL